MVVAMRVISPMVKHCIKIHQIITLKTATMLPIRVTEDPRLMKHCLMIGLIIMMIMVMIPTLVLGRVMEGTLLKTCCFIIDKILMKLLTLQLHRIREHTCPMNYCIVTHQSMKVMMVVTALQFILMEDSPLMKCCITISCVMTRLPSMPLVKEMVIMKLSAIMGQIVVITVATSLKGRVKKKTCPVKHCFAIHQITVLKIFAIF